MTENFSIGETAQFPQEQKTDSGNAIQGIETPKILPRIRMNIQKGENAFQIAEETRGQGEIGYDELSNDLKEGLSEDEFNELISRSVMKDLQDVEKLIEQQMSLYPQLESEKFKEEVENPNFRLDPETGINYAVRWLNNDKKGKPLVVKQMWSAGANSRTSRGFLSALSSQMDRPIVVIDSVATGDTSIPDRKWIKQATFDTMADSEKRILDAELDERGLGDSRIDILGISMGGIQAAKLAERYGVRVDKLLTFSTPGFVKRNPLKFALGFAVEDASAAEKILEAEDLGIKEQAKEYESIFGQTGIQLDRKKLPGLYKVMPGLLHAVKPFMDDFAKMLPPEQFSSEQIPAFFRFYHLMTRAPLGELPNNLNAGTEWIDLVGSADAITDYSDHLEAVRARNKTLRINSSGRMRGDQNYNFLHTSNVHVLGSDPHSWLAITTEVADKAVELLKDKEDGIAA